MRLLQTIYRKLRPTVIKGEGNSVSIKSRRRNFIIRIYGSNNHIEIGENCRLKNTEITIYGNNNYLIAEGGSKFDGPCLISLYGNAKLSIGRNSGIRGVTFVLQDADITVGRNCMFGYGILLRNNDAHKVLDKDGNVTNPARNIVIKDHVWLCEKSSVLKGVTVGENSVLAYGAVVTKNCPPNSVMAGNPASVVKQEINWLNK